MLNIKNIKSIEGNEFQIQNQKKFIIGMAKDEGLHYTFGVFPILENGVASIKDAIVFNLHRALLNRRGYQITSAKMNRMAYVKPENLTLYNFVLELRIQTAMICSQ